MRVEVKALSIDYEKKYMDYVNQKRESLMYYSLKYRDFISEILDDRSEYLIAIDESDEVVGCMPVFFRENAETGVVANSLPYYGGHGGMLADDDEVRVALLEKYMEVVRTKGCVAATIIGSPLENLDEIYKRVFKPDFIDERIELMTYFPYESGPSFEESLMQIYHYKERNSIRKAQKNDIIVEVDNSDDAVTFLHTVHTENMKAVGGQPKSLTSFRLIKKLFAAGEDYDIFVARRAGERIAALLVFYFNGTVEYYTPAIVAQYRNLQPLALIIYVAMNESMKKAMKKWNWGGTGLSQKSLYDFKSKWGTTESRYYYYTRVWDDSIMKMARSDLVKAYTNYYVYPFD